MAQVVTGKVRFSYLNAFEPRSNNGGESKVFCTLLIPKTSVPQSKQLTLPFNRLYKMEWFLYLRVRCLPDCYPVV